MTGVIDAHMRHAATYLTAVRCPFSVLSGACLVLYENPPPYRCCLPRRHPMISLNVDVLFMVLYAGALAIVSSLRKHALTQNKVNKLNWDLASAAPSLFPLPPLITLLGVRGTEFWFPRQVFVDTDSVQLSSFCSVCELPPAWPVIFRSAAHWLYIIPCALLFGLYGL